MGQRQSFSGNAKSTAITANVGSTDDTIAVSSTTNWPDTSKGPFAVTLDKGLSSEEKVLISSYTTSLLTVATINDVLQRGYDGTTAQTHTAASGTAVPTIDAAWFQDVSDQFYDVDKGDLPYASDDGTPGKLSIGTSGQVLKVDSGVPAWGDETAVDAATIEATFTAAGQIYAGTGDGTGELLAKGTSGQVLKVGGSDDSGLEWADSSGGDTVASEVETSITDASTWQTIASYTPSATGLFIVQLYFEVPSGGAQVGAQVAFDDSAGSETLTIYATASATEGPWSTYSALIAATDSAAIEVQAQSDSTDTVVSATIKKAS